jgi:hypothetical protein
MSTADRAAFYGPEVHRLEGELRAKVAPSDPDGAEACFRKALDLADARAVARAARRYEPRPIWCSQGMHGEARTVLAPVYDSFSEGFDLPDLKQAKVLLDQLAANSELTACGQKIKSAGRRADGSRRERVDARRGLLDRVSAPFTPCGQSAKLSRR